MICLTFDTDWMTDESIARFLREIPIPGKATFFAHDHFQLLHASDHEIGPHPFFDDLRIWQQDLQKLVGGFPSAPRGIRPHSCVFSHVVGVGLHALGYRYVSQAHGLFHTNLAPFRHPWGIWELPIYYMDSMDFWMPKNWPKMSHTPMNPEVIQNAIESDALFVFDFHPLHIALNTRSHEDYASVKNRVIDGGESPFELAFRGRGVRVFFEELCEAMRARRIDSVTCMDALRLHDRS